MAYNMGQGNAAKGRGLSSFVKLKDAIKAKNWTDAADEIVDSDYCGEVGTRCDRNMALVCRCNKDPDEA